MRFFSIIVTLFLLIASFHCKAQQFLSDDLQVFTMKATYYHDRFVGRKTANGETFSHDKYTCAHKTIPLGSFVEVTNPETNDQVILKVNDRCPHGGILDMTRTAMAALDIPGTGPVQVRILTSEQIASAKLGPVGEKKVSAKKNKKIKAGRKNKKRQTETVAKTKKQKKTDTPAAIKQPTPERYDILLCIERSQHSAELHASIIQPKYISKLEYIPYKDRIKVILRLNMTQSQLTPIIEDLSSSHPRLSLIKHLD